MYWCLGMYGSASTWTFNVTRRIAETLLPAKPVLSRFVADDPPTAEEAAANTFVAKTHATPAYEALARDATAIIITIRDPRDAIASLLAHNRPPFATALDVTHATAAMCAHFMADPRALVLKFENRFFDEPATIVSIAARFPGTLSPEAAASIFAAHRREAVEAFIANLATSPEAKTEFDTVTNRWDTYDPITGWHQHHAGRAAEIGRWRRDLTPGQIVTIEQRLGPLMKRLGYEQPPAYTPRVGRYGVID